MKASLAGLVRSLGPMKVTILAITLISSVAFAITFPKEAALYLPFFVPMVGGITVTYENPVQGVTAPTAAQSLNTNRVAANVIATLDADTTATITHNFGIVAGPGPTGSTLANGAPIVILEPLLQAPAALSLWAVTSKTTNTVVCTKATTGSSGNAGAQLRVHVLRHSILDD